MPEVEDADPLLGSDTVPIYEYVCMECESHFEELVRNGEEPDCPDCASANVRKQFSVFATHGAASSRASVVRPAAAVAAVALWLRPLSLCL